MAVDDLKRISRTLTTHPIGASLICSRRRRVQFAMLAVCAVQEDDGRADALRG